MTTKSIDSLLEIYYDPVLEQYTTDNTPTYSDDDYFDEVANSIANNGTYFPEVKKVVFCGPATTVLFEDGTKVTVKLSSVDNYDRELAVVYAIVKRLFGTVSDKNPGEVISNGVGNKLAKLVANGFDQNLKCKVKDIDPATGKAKVVEKKLPEKTKPKKNSFRRKILDSLEVIAKSFENQDNTKTK